jgi:hypothetical protein
MLMPSNKNKSQDVKDTQLVEAATRFLKAYSASAESGVGPLTAPKTQRPFTLGAGGIVEITEEIADAQSEFVHRAAKLLKSKAAHEKAISNIATNCAHEFVAENKRTEMPSPT